MIDRATLQQAWELNKQHGFYEPFQTIGVGLSLDSALSTWSARSVRLFRQEQASEHRDTSLSMMDKRIANLSEVRRQIAEMISEFDRRGFWEPLLEIRKQFDSREMGEVLNADFGLHGFPAIIRSAEWNADFIKEHGVREYYIYTDGYLSRVQDNVSAARKQFEEDVANGYQSSAWLEMMDLVGIETGIHCDTCRITISFLIRLHEMTTGNRYMWH